eukprot:516126-Pelagomonas_calceolata.AAC.2
MKKAEPSSAGHDRSTLPMAHKLGPPTSKTKASKCQAMASDQQIRVAIYTLVLPSLALKADVTFQRVQNSSSLLTFCCMSLAAAVLSACHILLCSRFAAHDQRTLSEHCLRYAHLVRAGWHGWVESQGQRAQIYGASTHPKFQHVHISPS